MKTQIGIILVFLSLFVVPSPQTEAAITNGKVQYYYESSTETSDSSTRSTQSSTTIDVVSQKDIPASPISRSNREHSGNTRLLQTNDQQNTILVIIGLLILAIAFLGWRIVKNRRKN